LAPSSCESLQRHHRVPRGGRGVFPHRDTRKTLAPHDEGRTVYLSPTGALPAPTGTTDVRGDQVATMSISAVAQKRSGWKPKTARAVLKESLSERKKLKLIANE